MVTVITVRMVPSGEVHYVRKGWKGGVVRGSRLRQKVTGRETRRDLKVCTKQSVGVNSCVVCSVDWGTKRDPSNDDEGTHNLQFRGRKVRGRGICDGSRDDDGLFRMNRSRRVERKGKVICSIRENVRGEFPCILLYDIGII